MTCVNFYGHESKCSMWYDQSYDVEGLIDHPIINAQFPYNIKVLNMT
jgi:hypothetical protein